MEPSARKTWIWVGAWAVLASASMILAGAEAQRYPVSRSLVVLGVVLPAVAAGFVLGHFRWALLGFLYVPLVVLAATEAENGLLVLAAFPAVAAAAAAIAAGVAARRIRDARAGSAAAYGAPLRGLASVGLGIALLPYAVAYAEKHRTVMVHGARPIAIDESRGLVSGVGLGNRPAQVTARFGTPGTRGIDGGIGTLAAEHDYPRGPGVLPHLRPEHDLAYPQLFFASDTKVRYLEVTDRRARLSRGVGPGDSISLLRRAYPQLSCAEDDAGEDEPIPYPACHGQLGPRVYAYVSGDYGRAGTPVVEIWLADFPLAPGDR